MNWVRRVRFWFTAAVTVVALAAATVLAVVHLQRTSATDGMTCSADFYSSNSLLGPATLPTAGPEATQLRGYNRLGGLSEEGFLHVYRTATTVTDSYVWSYPSSSGFLLGTDQQVRTWTEMLRAGQHVDRYGAETGQFLSPSGLNFAARALPPDSLDGQPPDGCNYHDYAVMKPFEVTAGPIAPAFGQPGGGVQYVLTSSLVPGSPSRLTVGWLVDNGFLSRA